MQNERRDNDFSEVYVGRSPFRNSLSYRSVRKMSWQDDAMIEQDAADALFYMGEAEWREMCGRKRNKNNENPS